MPPSDDFRPVRDHLPSPDAIPDAVTRINRNRDKATQKPPDPIHKAMENALKLLAMGAKVMPVRTLQKDPTNATWDRAVKSHPQAFLNNPGTHNYGVFPPAGCVILDVDKGAPELIKDLSTTLGHLPATRTHASPNGMHVFYRWPESLPRPTGPWWGEVIARWPHGEQGEGYVVGPGSQVTQEDGSVGDYLVFIDEPIADLPLTWAQSVIDWRPPAKVNLSGLGDWGDTDAYVLPDHVPSGTRYDAILRFSAHKYNLRLSRDEVWAALQTELVPRFDEPLRLPDLRARFRRAWQGIESRLGPPATPEPLPPQVGDPSGLFEPQAVRGMNGHAADTDAVVASTDVGATLDSVSQTGQQQPAGVADQSDSVVAIDPRHAPLAVPPQSAPVPVAVPVQSVPAPSVPPPTDPYESSHALAARLLAMGPIPYLVEDVVVAGGLNLIAGHPKSGKTLGLLQMLASWVIGHDFLTHSVLDAGTRLALYTTQEGSRYEMATRLERLHDAFPGLAASNRLRVAYSLTESFAFDPKQQVRMAAVLNDYIGRLAARTRPLHLWLVLDPLRDFMPTGSDENEAKVMATVKHWCRGLLAAFNQSADVVLTITLVHHLRKDARGDTGLDMSGSGALYGMGDSTVIWRATKTEEVDPNNLFAARSLRGVYHAEARGDEAQTRGWRYEQSTGLIIPAVIRQYNTVAVSPVPGVAVSPQQDLIVDALDAAGLRGLPAGDIAAQVGKSSNVVRAQLSRLAVAGAVVKVGDHWHLAKHSPSNDPDGLIPPDATGP